MEQVKGVACPKCGAKYVYVRVDGTIICRACGAKTPKVSA